MFFLFGGQGVAFELGPGLPGGKFLLGVSSVFEFWNLRFRVFGFVVIL